MDICSWKAPDVVEKNLKGEQVAARVTPEDAAKDEWLVVKVIHFDKETREFEVLDEEPGDDEESTGQRKYKLPMSHVIPISPLLPMSLLPEHMSWQYIQKPLHCTRQQWFNLERGRQTILCWNLTMMKRMGPVGALPQVVPLPHNYRQ